MNNINDDRSYSGLVEKYIGTAYDTVKQVADALTAGWLTANNMQVLETNESFLEESGISLDLEKPYFTRGLKKVNDGGAAYYLWSPNFNRSNADGIIWVDPTVPLTLQGDGHGLGAWVRQTAGNSDPGPMGPAGPRGPQGYEGHPGNDGNTGSRGEPGSIGHDGPDGPQGEKGDPGHKGQGIHLLGAVRNYDDLLDIQYPIDGDVHLSLNTGDLWIYDNNLPPYLNAHWYNVGHVQGPPGHPGPSGSQGSKGDPGSEGHQGEIGVQGPQGVTGSTGTVGPDGPVGPQGATGSQGAPGTGVRVMGVDLETTIRALTGTVGDMWIVDPTGHGLVSDGTAGGWQDVGSIRGPDGEQGPLGPEGPTGPSGPSGANGAQGIQGNPGPAGAQGNKGDQGDSGPQGVAGHDGAGLQIKGNVATHADLVHIAHPFNGHIYFVIDEGDLYVYDDSKVNSTDGTSWFDLGHVQGPAGHEGPKGDDGDKGDIGDTGDTGLTGSQGPAGAKGEQGIQGGRGEKGEQGMEGPHGLDGSGVVIKGSATLAVIKAIHGIAGEMWIETGTGHGWVSDGTIGLLASWTDVGPIRGPIGPHGPDGATGPDGGQGLEGPHGAQGAQGIKGDTGDQGGIGVDGVQGIQGVPGHNGQGIHIKSVVNTIPELLAVPHPDPGDAHLVLSDGDLWIYDPMQIRTMGVMHDWHNVGHIQGPAGHTGATGAQGVPGPDGGIGPNGPAGIQGIQGAVGPHGPKGTTGPQGPQGQQGSHGADGTGVVIKGTATHADILLKTGMAGDLWIDKITGEGWIGDGRNTWINVGNIRGPVGLQGSKGAIGAVGDTGPQGHKGSTGLQGIQGTTGKQGTRGVVGPRGEKGEIGDHGQGIHIRGAVATVDALTRIPYPVIGEVRLVHETTELWVFDPNMVREITRADDWHLIGKIQGDDGPQGIQGEQGATGTDGNDGTDGHIGLDGKAATIAVSGTDTGNEGTLARVVNEGSESAAKFVFTIPRGATGAQGVAGRDGVQGAPGLEGDVSIERTHTISTDTYIVSDADLGKVLIFTNRSAEIHVSIPAGLKAAGRFSILNMGAANTDIHARTIGIVSLNGESHLDLICGKMHRVEFFHYGSDAWVLTGNSSSGDIGVVCDTVITAEGDTNAGQAIRFTALGNEGILPSKLSWSVDGGAISITDPKRSMSCIWSSPGTYTVSVIATYPSGCIAKDSYTIIVAAPTSWPISIKPPTAEIMLTPWTGKATLELEAVIDPAAGTIKTYDWSGGKIEKGAATAKVVMSWSSKGTKTVALRVTYASGAIAEARATVQVTEFTWQ